jgi:acyl carrier protein
MDLNEKKQLLADLFEIEPETIIADMLLSDLEAWDSMSKLSLIVLMDDECNKKLTGEKIQEFVTIGDILDFMD